MKELRGLLKNKYYNENTLSILQIALFSCDENSLLEINLVNESEKIVYGVILKVVAYNANKEVIEATAKAHGKANSDNGRWIWPGTVLTIPEG